MGDQNSDPLDAASLHDAIEALLANPRIDASFVPQGAGGPEAAALQGGANTTQRGDPRFDTADFNDHGPGNLRVDYVLPSRNLRMLDGAVFWPLSTDPLFRLVGTFPFPTSDHRLVWVDVGVH